MLLNPSKGKPTAIPTVKARQQSAGVVGSLLVWMPLSHAICYLDSINADPHAETQFIPNSTLAVHSLSFSLGIQWLLVILANSLPKSLVVWKGRWTNIQLLFEYNLALFSCFFFRNVQNIRFQFNICFSLYFAHTEPTLLVTPHPLFPILLSQIILLLGCWRPQASHRDPFKMFHC